MDSSRRAAFLTLKEIEQGGKWVNLALSEQLKAAGDASPAFVRELVYTCVRNQKLLDYNIGRFLKKPKLSASERVLLRMGFCQLSLMNGVAEHAAVNETVALAAKFVKGRQGFINAILRSFQRDGSRLFDDGLSTRYSCAQWIIDLWTEAYGAEKAEELLRQSNMPAPFVIRVNTLKTGREELIKALENQGFTAVPTELSRLCLKVSGSGALDTPEYAAGLFSVQGEASAAAVELLAPKAGETLLDLCAAPGGKSCCAAELMGDAGIVRAFDLYPHRTELISKEAGRLGLKSVFVNTADSQVYDPELSESADCVLADVPCSGLGTLRRNPEIKLRDLPVEDAGETGDATKPLEELTQIQYNILINALKYAKPGGRVLYSTCTVNPAENGQLVRRALEGKDFRIKDEQQLFPTEGGPDGFYTCLIRKAAK